MACFLLFAIAAGLAASPRAEAGPGDVFQCAPDINLSNSPGYTSVDPFILADPAGKFHLFWAERTLGRPDASTDVPDALMYAEWEDGAWSRPVDIFISPPEVFNRKIAAPRATMDEVGNIHLIWMGPDYRFYYSSALAEEAGNARSWREPILMADDHAGSQFALDIAYQAPGRLHVLYGSGTGGASPTDNRTNRAITYTRSTDGGVNWTHPVDIYTFSDPQRGPSNIRLRVDGQRLYATWTEWDDSGNGQAIYFARSLDGGETWQDPVMLSQRVGDEYERDWTNVAVLGEDQLVAMWEGGYRAYPQAQYSFDAGRTWSEAIDTFYWLIADNGYAEFVRDGSDRLHVFLARRIREGYESRCERIPGCEGTGNAIWHSVWEGGVNWREPRPVGEFSDVNFISVALLGGNQLAIAWFDYFDYEINVLMCQIEGAASLPPQPWPTSTPTPAPEPTPTFTPTPPPQAMPTLTPVSAEVPPTPGAARPNLAFSLLISILPVAGVIAGVAFIHHLHRRRS
jgi:hypothetical protein